MIACAAASVLWSTGALATDFTHGPAPTAASLEATAGPYAVASIKVDSPSGYGSATVYYPTETKDGKFGLIGFAPGFLSTPGYYTSHGFVVVSMGTKTIFDSPEPRGQQLVAALKQVTDLVNAGKYYPTLSAQIDRAYLEVANADHLSPTFLGRASAQNTIGKTVISWLKRYVDGDKRYESFISGASSPEYSKTDVHLNVSP